VSRVRQSPVYRLIHAYVRWLYTACYCRTFEVRGRDQAPETGPVLFVATHQNNLADGLSLVAASPRRPVFAVRADFFQAPLAARGFRLLRAVPMYRADHGRRAIADKLPETMGRLRAHLAAGGSCVIMAEGSSAPTRTLRRLKKGWARLALDVLEDAPDLTVVPVAIEYSGWDRWGPDVRVVFGAPLAVEPAGADVPRQLNAMNGRMHAALSALLADAAEVAAWRERVTERRRGRDLAWRLLGLPALLLVLVAFAPVFLLARQRVRQHPRDDFRSTLEIAFVGLGVPVWAAGLGAGAWVAVGGLATGVGALALPLILWMAARCWIAWTAA
jgi:1-acyl-sn-glycerol-3-phosphate acyltransferase